MQITTYHFRFKTLIKKSFFFFLFSAFFCSCEKPPKYTLEPVIALDTITNIRKFDAEGTQTYNDSITISLRFKDGDGNLGVSKSDAGNVKYRAYSDTSVSTSGTTYTFRNYRTKLFRKDKGVFKEVKAFIPLNGTFEELMPYDEIGPIDGVLNYGFKLTNSLLSAGFKNNDTVRFDVFLIDRELNFSNIVTTTEVVILKK